MRPLDAHRSSAREAIVDVRPNVGGRFVTKDPAIGGQRRGVHVAVMGELFWPPFGRKVVQRLLQPVAAEIVPVRSRVTEVQVPSLVDRLWGTGRPRGRREQEETSIFLDHPLREPQRPVVLAGKSYGKGLRRRRVVEPQLLETSPECLLIDSHRHDSQVVR